MNAVAAEPTRERVDPDARASARVKVSLIVITHNKLDYLRATLASIEEIAFPRDDFEVLVVDDGSTDATGDFLQAYAPNYQFAYRCQRNAGRPAARNACARMARGELLVILDDDCLPRPGSLDTLWRAHRANPTRVLLSSVRHVGVNHVAGIFETIAHAGAVPWQELPELAPVDNEYALAGLIRKMLVFGVERFAVPWVAAPATSVAIPAAQFHDLGGYDEQFRQYGMEDFDLAYRYMERDGAFEWVPDSVLFHLDHGHDRAVLFRESAGSARLFYEKFRGRVEIERFVKFLCGAITFREFNNEVASVRGTSTISQFNLRFSPYGMIRYRDSQQNSAADSDEDRFSYSQAQDYRLRFLIDRVRQDIEPERQASTRLPALELGAARSVLVVAPHMDDEVIGCGGLIYRLSCAQSTVTTLFLTDGASRNLPPARYHQMCHERRVESELAADILGTDRSIYLDIPERHLAKASLDVAPIVRVLREVRPDVILVPSEHEYHPDHRIACDWTLRALTAAQCDAEVVFYEVWGSSKPNRVCEVDEAAWQAKVRALSVYRTQLQQLDYLQLMGYLARSRASLAHDTVAYAEAYRRTSPTPGNLR